VVVEKLVLRSIIGPMRDKVRECRTLYNEELKDVYSSPNIIWVIKSITMKWVGQKHVWGRGEVHTGFWWGNLKERPLGRPRRVWGDNIKMDLQGGMDWTDLGQERDMCQALVNVVVILCVPQNVGNFLTS
jgi:hypothetical protein